MKFAEFKSGGRLEAIAKAEETIVYNDVSNSLANESLEAAKFTFDGEREPAPLRVVAGTPLVRCHRPRKKALF